MALKANAPHRLPSLISVVAAVSLLLGGCAVADTSQAGQPITLGASMDNRTLDPAGTFSVVDQFLIHQLYPVLVNSQPGSAELEPDITVSAEYISPTTYRVVLKPDLKFANGNVLSASDVEFSLNRQVSLADEYGPSVLLANFLKATAVDDLTVDLEVSVEFDQTFPHALSSIAGAIVDEEVFAADRIMTNEELVEASPFAGPYVIGAFALNEVIEFLPNAEYRGLWEVKNSGVVLVNYDDANNMILDFEAGELDLALVYRTIATSDLNRVAESTGGILHTGQAAEPGFLGFHLAQGPFGSASDNPDPVKAKAVRQAVAHLVGEKQIAEDVFGDAAFAAYSTVPSAVFGSYPAFERYGKPDGTPDLAAAQAVLVAAGVDERVSLDITYSSSRFGQDLLPLFAILKQQLEQGDLFTVNLFNTDANSWSQGRREAKFPMWGHNWGPDYGDPANYLAVLFRTGGALRADYSNPELDKLFDQEASEPDREKRAQILEQIQRLIAEDVPAFPFYERGRILLAKDSIKGVSETLDVSFKFRLANLER